VAKVMNNDTECILAKRGTVNSKYLLLFPQLKQIICEHKYSENTSSW